MKEAPDDARGAMNAYPFAISYPGRGTYNIQPAGSSTGIHRVVTEIHMASEGDLAQALKHLQAYLDDFSAAILNDPTVGAHASTIVTGSDGPPLSYTLVSGVYNGVKTIALRFETTLKIQNTIP
jgi:hypothetical protein